MIVTAKDLLQRPSFHGLSVQAIRARFFRWRKRLNKAPGQAVTLEEIAELLGIPPEQV